MRKQNPHHVPYLRLGLYYLGSRALLLLVGWLSFLIIAKGEFATGETRLWTMISSWDALWYLDIAQNGYFFAPDRQSSVNFFPAYPLLIRLLSYLSMNPFAAGYLISNVAAYFSCVYLWRLALEDGEDLRLADKTVLFFVFNPVSFFFSLIYTEGLFLFVSVAAMYYARRGKLFWAGIFGLLAGLTRSVGFFLFLPLLVEACQLSLTPPRFSLPTPKWPVVFCFFPLLGLGLYLLYLYLAFGDPFVYQQAAAHWHRWLTFFWVTISNTLSLNSAFFKWWYLGAAAYGLLLGMAGIFLKLRLSYLCYLWLYLVLHLSTNKLDAIPRYLSVLFPLYLINAMIALRFPQLEPFLFYFNGLFAALSVILFANGYFFV